MRSVMRVAWCMVLLLLAGCAAPQPEGPSKDWQKDLQKAIEQQKEKGN